MSVDAVRAVIRSGGIARTSALRARGVTRRSLTRAVADGRLRRARVGVYALPGTPPAVMEALAHCGVVACITAARVHGLWALDAGGAETSHVWVDPDHRTVRVALEPGTEGRACCVFHRDIALEPPSIDRVGVLQCLLQILGCRGAEPFFAALESALRQRLLDRAARRALRSAIPKADRWLVDFARSDADSGLESLLRLRLWRAHGIVLASQVAIPGVGDVDFVLGDCLIIEADGKTHDGPSRHADRVRDAAATALGFTTLRFDYAMIVHDWELVESAILSAVRRGVHRSAAGLTW